MESHALTIIRRSKEHLYSALLVLALTKHFLIFRYNCTLERYVYVCVCFFQYLHPQRAGGYQVFPNTPLCDSVYFCVCGRTRVAPGKPQGGVSWKTTVS